MLVLRTAIAEGVDYVDLEDDIAGTIPRFGKTKRIVSYHNFRETPGDLDDIHARLASKDADIVKLATMAHRPDDNLRMLRLVAMPSSPPSACAWATLACPRGSSAAALARRSPIPPFPPNVSWRPGQIGYKQMREIYRYEQITPATEVYGVIADPVVQNMLPVVHNAGFRELKMDKVYVPFRVLRDELRSFMDDCRELGVKGLSVADSAQGRDREVFDPGRRCGARDRGGQHAVAGGDGADRLQHGLPRRSRTASTKSSRRTRRGEASKARRPWYWARAGSRSRSCSACGGATRRR